MRFWTAQICQFVIRNAWRFQEKSCHMQVVIDPSFGWFCSQACSNYPSHLSPAYKEICDHTAQWLCCGRWPAALLYTFSLLTDPVTDFHGCIALYSYSGWSLCPEIGRPMVTSFLSLRASKLHQRWALRGRILAGWICAGLSRQHSTEKGLTCVRVVPWSMSEEKKACSLMDSFIIPAPAGWLILSPGSSQHNKERLYIQIFFSFLNWKQPFLILMKRSERSM